MANVAGIRGTPFESIEEMSTVPLSPIYYRDQIVGQSAECVPRGIRNERLREIFANAVKELAALDMAPMPSGISCRVPHGRVCGNTRDFLFECRCPTLDRKTSPDKRKDFEAQVLMATSQIVEHQLSQPGIPHFQLKLAMLYPGGLLGEEVLLFRLFDQLRTYSGSVEVFLIDPSYATVVNNGRTSLTTEPERAMVQFFQEIGQCLPPSVTFKMHVFANSAAYMQQAEGDGRFRHHLLIGLDVDGQARSEENELARRASVRAFRPLILRQEEGTALVFCGDDDGLANCVPIPEEVPDRPLPRASRVAVPFPAEIPDRPLPRAPQAVAPLLEAPPVEDRGILGYITEIVSCVVVIGAVALAVFSTQHRSHREPH